MNRPRLLVVFVFLLLLSSFLVAFSADAKAATPFEVSGWIPYWRLDQGTNDALSHLQNFNTIMPFGYIVQNDGSISDAFGLDATSSTSTAKVLTVSARAQKVKIVPTVMWSNGAATHTILSNGSRRRSLEDDIAALVKDNGFDGIDIDFENKMAKTRPYFSLFLQGLYSRMGNKLVYCSIEPRTPPSSAFAVLPPKLEYANDYVAINKYCDRVELMTYDQRSVDLKLNAAASTTPFTPIADPQWVRKVVNVAAQSISKKKIVIGVATYGYESDLIARPGGGYDYDLDWAFNPGYALTLAANLVTAPTRNSAGELSFIYTPTTTPAVASSTVTPHIVWWSDANAINDKIRLARELGVRGVAIFKIDGGEDPALWDILAAKGP